jgi:putative transcriptional regulator
MTGKELAGSLLVATPALGDPTFRRTVILVLDHDEGGTLGVVINRPTSVEVAEILPDWHDYSATPGVVFRGGPVALDSALGLAGVAGDDEPLGFRRVVGDLGLVDLDAPPELLVPELSALRVFAGYSGWGSGQLDAELEEGSWFVVEAEPRDPFSGDPERLWSQVLRRQGGDLALLSTYPDDPALN